MIIELGMSEEQQLSPAPALQTEQDEKNVRVRDDEQIETIQQKHLEKRAIDPKKRALLKNLVKKNTLCHHLQIYTQANVICRRISYSYEEGRISEKQAMELMFEAHEQMTHRGLPKDVVATEMHKRLDKLENNDKTSFAVIMANTNSSVHTRGVNNRLSVKDKDSDNDSNEDKYSESYWAEII
jgi:superfamily II helicase